MSDCYINREEIVRFINDQGLLTYMVRSVQINNYVKSLLALAALLTQTNIYSKASSEVRDDIIVQMRSYIDLLHQSDKYDELASQVLTFKLSVHIYDVFGESLDSGRVHDLYTASQGDLDRQLRAADAKLGNYGFHNAYGKKYYDVEDPNAYKVDCILFAADNGCIDRLNKYAKDKFHSLNDQYRKYVATKDERTKKQYSDIIADGDAVSKHNFSLPETISARIERDGEAFSNHLFADENGLATIKLNSWEREIIEEESKKEDFVCWLRNPPRDRWSLCIPYEMNGEFKAAYPDFIIIRKDPLSTYALDILEPHNPDYKDNLGKAKGFAKYAEAEKRIGSIQLIRKSQDSARNTRFKRLDLSKGLVREKVLNAHTHDEFDHIFDTEGFFA